MQVLALIFIVFAVAAGLLVWLMRRRPDLGTEYAQRRLAALAAPPMQPPALLTESEFNDAGELVNFVSEDRGAFQKDGSLRLMRWSTPLRDYREFEGRRAAARGEAVYRYPEGDFAYARFVVRQLRFNVEA